MSKEFKLICPLCKKEFTDGELWKHLKETEHTEIKE